MNRAMAVLGIGSLVIGCRSRPDTTVALPPEEVPVVARESDPPVVLDAEPVVEYPLALFQQRLSGTVLLRLYADESGKLVADSSRIQESSGYPALDSAALAAAPRFRYAPARRNGIPVATAFTQPVYFRHPDRGGATP